MFASLAIAGLGWVVPLAGLLGVGSLGGLVYAVGPVVALGLAKKGLSAAWSWLSHRSFWQLASLALAAVCLLLIYQRNDARHDRDSYKTQRDYYVGELKRITSARDEQRKTSERTVREVVEGQERVKTVVKTIHDAPNPEGCRTPGLELLRNTL